MRREIYVSTTKSGIKYLQDDIKAFIVLASTSVGDTIRIVHDDGCIDELMVVSGDIDNQCDACAASRKNGHGYLCKCVPCSRGPGYNPRIPVSISDMLEDL